MLPNVKDTIEVSLKGYLFKFKRLTWRETLASKYTTKQERLASALLSISGNPVNFEGALKVIKSLPIPIQDRVYIIYIGSQDERRLVTTTAPWSAPEAVDFKNAVDEELETEMSESEASFAQQYGKQALEDEKELSREIIKNSGYKGAILKEKSDLDDGWSDE